MNYEAQGDLIFPIEVGSQISRPMVVFTAYDRNPSAATDSKLKRVYLPNPGGIQFNDAAQYTSIELGTIAAGVAAAGTGGDVVGEGGIGQMVGDSAQALALGTEAASKFLKPSAQRIKNPHTNTTFTGNGIRNFAFNFKLVATNQAESREILMIHHRFRKYAYGAVSSNSGVNPTLDFPAVWTIRFVDSIGSSLFENKFIPRIYSCYLTQVESTFNSEANLYFTDKSPVQVDISLQFQETRALTRNDIDSLHSGSLGMDRDITKDGRAGLVGERQQNPDD